MSSLREVLDSLEGRNFDADRGAPWLFIQYDRAVLELADALSIDRDFVHSKPNIGEGLKPTALVRVNELKKPWALFEVVPDSSEDLKERAKQEVQKYLCYTEPDLAVIFSPAYVIVLDPEGEVMHEVDATDESALRKIELELEPPEMYKQQEENSGPAGRRTQNYVMGKHYEVDLKRLEDAIDAVDQAATSQEKGDTFEDLAELLFGAIPFLRVRGRKELTKTSEIDLVVEYIGHSKRTIFNNWSDLILVECKNWSESVGAPQVRDFRGKMNELKVSLGVLFARNGVSGDANSDAQCLIRDTYKGDDVMILVVADEELNRLLEGESFYEILDGLMYERRVDVR